jgi:hypothetical protein
VFGCLKFESEVQATIVIACDKREAFAHGSPCDEAIHISASRNMDCFAALAKTAVGASAASR